MNEKKKVGIVLGVLGLLVVVIVIGLINTNKERQKIMDAFQDIFASKTEEIIYLGRPGCSHCANFKPILEKVVADYELSYFDINIDDLTDTQLNKILKDLGLDINNFGTPTTVIVKENKVLGVQEGETTEESFVKLLKEKNVISE